MLRILIILLLLLATPVSAKYYNGTAWVDDVCKYYNGSAWVDCTKNRYDGASWVEIEAPVSGCAYDLCESFDAIGYDNTWMESGALINADYTTAPAPLEGTQSLYLDDSGAGASTYTSITPSSGVYAYFQTSFVNVSASGAPDWVEIADASGTALMIVRPELSGINNVQVRCNDAGNQASGTFDIPTGATTHLWLEYIAGTGADAVCRVFVSATATKPGTADVNITTGTGTADAARLYFFSDGADRNDYVVDKVRIDSAAIGSDPL